MPGGPSPSVGPSDSRLPGARHRPGPAAPARPANATQVQASHGRQRELLRGSQGVPPKACGDRLSLAGPELTCSQLHGGTHPSGRAGCRHHGQRGLFGDLLVAPWFPPAGLFYLVHVSAKLNGAAPVPEVFPETTGGASRTRGLGGRNHLSFILLLNPEERKRLLGRCRVAPGPSVCPAGSWPQASGCRSGSLSALRPKAAPQKLPLTSGPRCVWPWGPRGGGGGAWTV